MPIEITASVAQFFESFFAFKQVPVFNDCFALSSLTGVPVHAVDAWFTRRQILESLGKGHQPPIGSRSVAPHGAEQEERKVYEHDETRICSPRSAEDHPTLSEVPVEVLTEQQDAIFKDFALHFQAIVNQCYDN